MFVGFLPGGQSGRYTSERSLRGEREPRADSEEVGHGRFEQEGSNARGRVHRGPLVALASAAASGQTVSEDFSETRLREGKEAYDDRRPVDAIKQLRIAAFGFLERPALLCESLIYLAVADEAAERHGDAQATVDRLLEIQRTMPACAEAKVSPAVRSTFETRFRQLLPGSVPPAAPPKGTPSPRPPPPAPTPRPGG